VLRAETLTSDLDEVGAVRQSIEAAEASSGSPKSSANSARSRLLVSRIEPRSYRSLIAS
jgi:hypothetical protein